MLLHNDCYFKHPQINFSCPSIVLNPFSCQYAPLEVASLEEEFSFIGNSLIFFKSKNFTMLRLAFLRLSEFVLSIPHNQFCGL